MKTSIIAASILATLSFSANALNLDIANIGDVAHMDAKIIVGAKSIHFDKNSREYLNESHKAVGFEVWDIQVIYVEKNSWNEQSFYVSWAPDYEINDYFTITPQIGFATGYYNTNEVIREDGYRFYADTDLYNESGIIPMVGATVSYYPTGGNFSLNTTITPAAAMFSASYDF